MSVQLLDKTRKINRLLQGTGDERIEFSDISEVMGEVLDSTVLIVSKKGKLLASHERHNIPIIEQFLTTTSGEYINEKLNERLLTILSTKENINLMTLGFSEDITAQGYLGLAIPVDIAGERLGTIFLYRLRQDYMIDDLILAEYSATVVGLEIIRSINQEESEETRKQNMVRSAISTLSFSEQDAVKHIFEELEGKEGVLIASKVADKAGITRSVIVNGLRKLESAGVIETRSLGMKGTFISIVNENLLRELNISE
ncbi:GTP-sensing pleiotropic transcriptional regulator CodY [Clostridiales bacterium COT073_COT-073]|nr:GTP-sensing pleiotropic transcriptional regulator CodY [Clostridiales bacterium COT073_COT-073]